MGKEGQYMNPFFDSHKQKQSTVPFGNGSGFDLNSVLQNLARQIAPTGMTPEQIVRQKIQNGEMTQEQFNQLAKIADRLTGGRR